MSNYNSTLQSNNTDLQAILNTINGLPNAGGSDPVLQDKTVTPSTSQQYIQADVGYDGLDTVTVNAMPTTTQATPSITINASGLITATATQTAGYVAAGSKSATKQLAFQAAKTITPTTASQIAVSSGYYTGGNIIVDAIPSTYIKPSYTKTATTYTPTTTNQTISAGTYCSGIQTIKGDANLVAGNIKSGVSIFGVNGTYAGSGGSSGDTSVEDSLVTKTVSSYTNSRVTSVGSYAFAYCSSLTTASFSKVTAIGNSAFQNCSKLTTASFPAATTIGSYAFAYCSSLTTASFPKVTAIENSAFRSCYSLTTASFPAATTIGSYVFDCCSKLTTASFPVATTIGHGEFGNCSKLTTASFPAATTIGSSAFCNCMALLTVSFPATTTIRSKAFYNCSSLTTVSFPKATSIYNYAFQNCYGLKSLYLTGSSVCTLSNSNAFSSTPIGGYSGKVGTYGSIYVPASLLASYQAATNWTYFSSRFVGI